MIAKVMTYFDWESLLLGDAVTLDVFHLKIMGLVNISFTIPLKALDTYFETLQYGLYKVHD